MKKLVFLAVPVFLLLVVGTAWCHQPRIVEGEDITQVENPEVSQAFYGELKREPAYYQIASEDPFKLYVGILVPDLEGIGKDVSVEITREKAHPEEAAKQEPEEEEMYVVSMEQSMSGLVGMNPSEEIGTGKDRSFEVMPLRKNSQKGLRLREESTPSRSSALIMRESMFSLWESAKSSH